MIKQDAIQDDWKELYSKIGKLMETERKINWLLEVKERVVEKKGSRLTSEDFDDLLAGKEDEFCKLCEQIETIIYESASFVHELRNAEGYTFEPTKKEKEYPKQIRLHNGIDGSEIKRIIREGE